MQIRELELRLARLESAAARQEALTPQMEAEMGQRLARIEGHVAAASRTLDSETKNLADIQRVIAVKQQVLCQSCACANLSLQKPADLDNLQAPIMLLVLYPDGLHG